MARFYGACGVEECADCWPLYDPVTNQPIPGTDDAEGVAEYLGEGWE